MNSFGFIKIAAGIPFSRPAAVKDNCGKILSMIKDAFSKNASVILFPELSVTGYTCQDLFGTSDLLKAALNGVTEIVEQTKFDDIVSIIGLPILWNNGLYNAACVVYSGQILGVVPKIHLPNYREFYEMRWFKSGKGIKNETIIINGKSVPFGTDIIFKNTFKHGFTFGIEICEDLWVANPPSVALAENGANMIFNLSASNITVGKDEYRKKLIEMQSAKLVAGYIYCSAGTGESTTDVVFDADAQIYENGINIASSKRFLMDDQVIYGDIDIERIVLERVRLTSFSSDSSDYRAVSFSMADKIFDIDRIFDRYPFVPGNKETLKNRCEDIFNIQSTGLARRLDILKGTKAVIGLSGGLDSTLALLVTIKAMKLLNLNVKDMIVPVTMPGFGTTEMTLGAVKELCNALDLKIEELSIKDISNDMYKLIGHEPSNHDITYENIQARSRTYILMSIANKVNGIVIGTGDLSEAALGWCTYNGDHISMYNVNASIPKTLVKFLIRQTAIDEYNGNIRNILEKILDFPISPELLPSDGKSFVQMTEDKIGPYELHDFFLYYYARWGFGAEKIKFMAASAFSGVYKADDIEKWFTVFINRFYASQWKRDCVPAGPKVGSVDLSPRGSWRMSAESFK